MSFSYVIMNLSLLNCVTSRSALFNRRGSSPPRGLHVLRRLLLGRSIRQGRWGGGGGEGGGGGGRGGGAEGEGRGVNWLTYSGPQNIFGASRSKVYGISSMPFKPTCTRT